VLDGLLGKNDFVKLLEEADLPKEFIDQQWDKIEGSFYVLLFDNIVGVLPESDQEELIKDIDLKSPNGIKTLFERVTSFIKSKHGVIDLREIVSRTTKQVADKYLYYSSQ